MPARLDGTFVPVLLSSMEEPLSRADMEAYFGELIRIVDEGLRARQRLVVIVTSDATKFTAAGRKIVAEAEARFMSEERYAAIVASYVPTDNALMRGALTALGWLAPNIVKSIRLVPSLEIALTQALQTLETSGSPFRGDRRELQRAVLSQGRVSAP
jgi:hypothetical protein